MNIKRVLFLNHPETCHSQYMLYSGLCQILGDENVILYPKNLIYWGEVADWYILDNGQKGFTAPNEYILPRKKIEKSIDEIKKEMSTFDIVFCSIRTYARRALDELRSLICQPLAIFDGEDSPDIRWDIINKYRPDVYFKREYLRDMKISYPTDTQPPIIPYPFSAITETRPNIDDTKKEFSVFSVHGFTHEMRQIGTKILLDMNIPNSYVWINEDFYFSRFNPYTEEDKKKMNARLDYWGYLEKIAKSRIGVSIRGWGRDTIRRWEIPMYETLLFTHDIGLIDPHPFEDGKTAVFFKNDFSDFKEKLNYYLQDENEQIKIAKAGKDHLYKFHTTQKRVEWILSMVKK